VIEWRAAKEGAVRVIVVGSGVVGASCAYTASCLGADVVMVEAGLPGQATAAGAGIVSPWASHADDPLWYAFAAAAARDYPRLIGELAAAGAGDAGYRQVGALYLADCDDDVQRVRRRLLERRAAAPEIGDIRVLAQAEARELFPPLRAETTAAAPGDGTAPRDGTAVYVSGAARVDGRLLAAALLRAAGARGAVTVAGTARLACRLGRAAGVVVNGQLIEADAVVAAAGAWTRAFAEPAGVTVAVSPQRGQIAHFSLAPADTSRWPVVLPAGDHYLLAFDDSRVVAGATRETGSGFDYRVTPGGLAEVLEHALAVAPGLAAATYLETRVGFRPAGPDSLPLLGPVAGVDGLIVATGLGATGLTMGPYAGASAARAALGLPQPIDLAPFDPLRERRC
jgi:D-amino-acid dehydrogenase